MPTSNQKISCATSPMSVFSFHLVSIQGQHSEG
jgi:hypothetical protein